MQKRCPLSRRRRARSTDGPATGHSTRHGAGLSDRTPQFFTPLFTPARFLRRNNCRSPCGTGTTAKSVRLTPESDIGRRYSNVRFVPCVDGAELARAFFTFAALVG